MFPHSLAWWLECSAKLLGNPFLFPHRVIPKTQKIVGVSSWCNG